MAPGYWDFFQDMNRFPFLQEVDSEVYHFWQTYSEYNKSSSKVGHLANGWFMIYDHPLAEKWLQENQRSQMVSVFTDTSYRVVHFSDLKDAMEFKLMWC